MYFQFILEGVTLEGSKGDIAVDDVTVLEEGCRVISRWSNKLLFPFHVISIGFTINIIFFHCIIREEDKNIDTKIS